jgi:hypothetical protein
LVIEEATATELADLAVEANRTYADVCADPTAGFGPAHASINAVSFSPESGPTLLFQAVFSYVDGQPTAARGTEILPIRPIEVVDGRLTMFLTAPTTRDRYRACLTPRSSLMPGPTTRPALPQPGGADLLTSIRRQASVDGSSTEAAAGRPERMRWRTALSRTELPDQHGGARRFAR